jgi:CheY-specific phosphatase CheX
MLAKFFGQWLVEREVITPEQLLEATELQNSKNITLGEAAISLNYLNTAQVERINIDQQRQDRRFGELAIEKNLINEAQMQELLALQKETNIFFGEAITRLGFLSEEQVEQELQGHKQSQLEHANLLQTSFEEVKEAETVRSFVDVTVKIFTRMIQQTVKIESISNTSVTQLDEVCFIQEVKGDKNFYYFLTLPKNHQLAIASKIVNMPQTEVNEIVLDSAREFVNIVSGSGCVKMGEEGMDLHLNPPVVMQANESFPAHYHAVLANMNSTEGAFQVGFLFE